VLAALSTGDADGLIVLDLDRAIRRMRSAQDLIDTNRATGAAGEMDADEWRAASKVIKNKLAALEARLTAAAQTATDAPAAALAGREDAAGVWQAMDLEAKRAVIRSLVTLTIARQGRGHRPRGWKRGESYS
jgi:hypothetical protein